MRDVVDLLKNRLTHDGAAARVSNDLIRAAIEEIEQLRGRYSASQESQTELLTELRDRKDRDAQLCDDVASEAESQPTMEDPADGTGIGNARRCAAVIRDDEISKVVDAFDALVHDRNG